jgi:PAS domain S-box-containing protein
VLDVVAEGANGLEAVDAARTHQPDLMLLDVSMPQMDGMEALPRVREVSPRTKVVVYSGFAEQGLAQRALELGASAFLEKSTSLRSLAEQLVALLGGPGDRSPAGNEGEDDVPASPADEAVLREHLERFREVFDVAAIGMATVTLAGRIVRANAAMVGIFGRSADALVGTAYADLAGAAAGQVRHAISQTLSGATRLAQIEHEVEGAGERRLVVATLAPVLDGEERPLYLFLQVQDVTAQREAEQQLRRSEATFRLLVESVEDYAIFMLSPEGIVESWNAGAERIKGYDEEEIVGQHFRRFYPVEMQEIRHPEHELMLALRDGHYEEEGWRVRKDGTRFWANVLITAVHDNDGKHVGFAKITRDISERRVMLEERQAAAAALEEANVRLQRAAEDQAHFLAVTAHELRTPVTVLAGTADTLRQHAASLDEEERQELLDGMVSSASRLRRLLADLLTASRLQSSDLPLTFEPVPLGPILENAVATCRRLHPETEVVLEPAPDVLVHGDADRLAQAVDNLIGNAVRHGAAPVRVSTRMSPDAAGVVDVVVADAGSGVPREIQDRLFRRFVTGQDGRGTGLGLYIVRHLARAHGGDASYRPTGDGGEFLISLPVLDGARR